MTERSSRPLPVSTPETAEFWEACGRGRFIYRFCRRCDRPHHFPRAVCPFCWRSDLEWRTASGRGTVYAYAIHYQQRSWLPSPYVTAVISLAEGPRVTMVLEGVEPDPAHIRVGMPVELVFEQIEDGLSLYKARAINEVSSHGL